MEKMEANCVKRESRRFARLETTGDGSEGKEQAHRTVSKGAFAGE